MEFSWLGRGEIRGALQFEMGKQPLGFDVPVGMRKPKAIVIGAGVSGLAVSIRLAAKGYEVCVIEGSETVGGKIAQHEDSGFRFDRGPSLFTMPELMEELDALVPLDLPGRPRPFKYSKLDRSTHYFWEDEKGPLIAWSDSKRFASEIDSRWGVPAEKTLKHLRLSKDIFELTRGVFLEKSLHKFKTYWSKELRRLLANLWKVPLLGTMSQFNARRLKHPKLEQVFNRYATYNGSDPHRAPAMLHAIPHLEHGIGAFLPLAGMRAIPEHLEQLARAIGVEIRTGSAVQKILHRNGKISGVLDASGSEHFAEVVVSNADVHLTYQHLLKDVPSPKRIVRQERSTSGLSFYWGVKGTHPELGLHNILFSKDYRSEFEMLSGGSKPGSDPTVYINITSKEISSDAPENCENWFILVNVAAEPEYWTETAIEEAREVVLAKITRTLGFRPDLQCEQVLTPRTIEATTGSWKGALYGASSNSVSAAFFRHRNQSKDVDGLFFCGGSVHPGGGIPLCLMGAKIVDGLVGIPAEPVRLRAS